MATTPKKNPVKSFNTKKAIIHATSIAKATIVANRFTIACNEHKTGLKEDIFKDFVAELSKGEVYGNYQIELPDGNIVEVTVSVSTHPLNQREEALLAGMTSNFRDELFEVREIVSGISSAHDILMAALNHMELDQLLTSTKGSVTLCITDPAWSGVTTSMEECPKLGFLGALADALKAHPQKEPVLKAVTEFVKDRASLAVKVGNKAKASKKQQK